MIRLAIVLLAVRRFSSRMPPPEIETINDYRIGVQSGWQPHQRRDS